MLVTKNAKEGKIVALGGTRNCSETYKRLTVLGRDDLSTPNSFNPLVQFSSNVRMSVDSEFEPKSSANRK